MKVDKPKNIEENPKNSPFFAYLDKFKKDAKESRVYSEHQFVGLNLAQILEDEKHKSLYIKLAKLHDPDALIALAKNIADNKNVKNKGAYFMAVWKKEHDNRHHQK